MEVDFSQLAAILAAMALLLVARMYLSARSIRATRVKAGARKQHRWV